MRDMFVREMKGKKQHPVGEKVLPLCYYWPFFEMVMFLKDAV